MSSIRDLVEEFVDQLSTAIETQSIARARVSVESALAGQSFPRGNGRLRAAAVAITAAGLARKRRKKPPIQLCPVPGCKERAAPIFGMVCAAHKDVSKTKIRKYREARRAGTVVAKSPAARARKAPSRKKATRTRARTRTTRTATAKPRQILKTAPAPAKAKVEVMNKPAQLRADVRAGASARRVKPKRPASPREAMPVAAPAPAAPAPAQA